MKSKIGIIILIVVIVLVILIALLMKNNRNSFITSGDIKEISEEVNIQSTDVVEEYKIEIPEGYTTINNDGIQNEGDLVAEDIAYYYNSGEDITYVKIYVQNRGTEPIKVDSMCNIELKAEDDKTYNIGAVIEDYNDLGVGERTVINTQFIEKTSNLVSAKVSLVNPEQEGKNINKEDEIVAETVILDEFGNN